MKVMITHACFSCTADHHVKLRLLQREWLYLDQTCFTLVKLVSPLTNWYLNKCIGFILNRYSLHTSSQYYTQLYPSSMQTLWLFPETITNVDIDYCSILRICSKVSNHYDTSRRFQVPSSLGRKSFERVSLLVCDISFVVLFTMKPVLYGGVDYQNIQNICRTMRDFILDMLLLNTNLDCQT